MSERHGHGERGMAAHPEEASESPSTRQVAMERAERSAEPKRTVDAGSTMELR